MQLGKLVLIGQKIENKKIILISKIVFAAVFLGITYIHVEQEIQREAEEQRQKDFQEFEAQQDALEEELRPLIERNKRIDAAAGIDIDSEN